MAAAADGPGERQRSGGARDRREPDRASGQRLLLGGDDVDRGDTLDLGAAQPSDTSASRDRRIDARGGSADRPAGGGAAHGAGAIDPAGGAARPTATHDRRPPRSTASVATLVVIVALVGLMAALLAGALAGADSAALAGGAVSGLVVGLVAGLLCARLTRPQPVVVHPVEPAGASRTPAGRTPVRAAGPPAGAGAADDGNLGPLLTSIGHRYQLLTDRQLVALAARPPADGGADGEGVRRNDDVLGAGRLARRMRRMAKTLQVLADDPTSWEAAAPATMSEVVAAAVADIDPLAPVDSRSLHPASIEGEAVPDVVHLLAELIENAVTASAASASRVVVIGRRTADGYVVSVVDEGSGMADVQRDRANAQLHSPPPLPRQPPTSLGLGTAGRLAARHGIGVTLLEAPTDGVIAKVRLPIRLLGGAPPDRGGSARPRSRSVIDLTEDEPSPTPGATAAATAAGRPGSSDGPGGRSREGSGGAGAAPSWTTGDGPFKRPSGGGNSGSGSGGSAGGGSAGGGSAGGGSAGGGSAGGGSAGGGSAGGGSAGGGSAGGGSAGGGSAGGGSAGGGSAGGGSAGGGSAGGGSAGGGSAGGGSAGGGSVGGGSVGGGSAGGGSAGGGSAGGGSAGGGSAGGGSAGGGSAGGGSAGGGSAGGGGGRAGRETGEPRPDRAAPTPGRGDEPTGGPGATGATGGTPGGASSASSGSSGGGGASSASSASGGSGGGGGQGGGGERPGPFGPTAAVEPPSSGPSSPGRGTAPGGSGADRSEPILSAAEARADLARRVQRSRPVPREVVPLGRDQRPADTAASGPSAEGDRRPGGTAAERAVEGSGDSSAGTNP